MTFSEKHTLIDRYLAGAWAFDDVLSLSPEVLTYRPSPDAWTIHEHVVHFAESDIASVHRYRKAVAEPNGPAVGYDEDAWTANLAYHGTDLKDAIDLIKLLRRFAANHLRTLVDRDWKQIAYTHSSRGRVDLETWFQDYIDHVRFHREYIDERIRQATGK